MKINSDELAEYVRAVLEGICKGVSQDIIVNDEPDTFSLSSPSEVSSWNYKLTRSKGEVKIFVAGLHGGKSNEQHARIEFEVSNKATNILEAMEKTVSICSKLPEKDQNSVKSLGLDFLRSLAAQNAFE